MLVQEKNEQISQVISKIYMYINSNLNLKKDLQDYYSMTGIKEGSEKILSTATINYIFERRIGKDKKSVFDLALAGMPHITEKEKSIIKSLKDSINGVFQVRRILKDGFELFNYINEKLYFAKPLDKMVRFKGVSVGCFLIARVVKFEDEYHLYHILEHISYKDREKAFQLVVTRQAQNPVLIYRDNPEKLQELKAMASDITAKFNNFFKAQFTTTSNKKIDELIQIFNEYMDGSRKISDQKIQKYIDTPAADKFFEVTEFSSGNDLFQTTKQGFSSHKKPYGVTLIADERSGLNVVPFFDVFMNIFESDDYTKIEGYKECMEEFVQKVKVPPIALQLAYEKYGEKFLSRVNEILETKFKSLDEIMATYKKFYLENEFFSSTTTLYSSLAFKNLLNNFEEKDSIMPVQKVGRNDPCPCNSGKKYKKCCGRGV
ncbi:MAG: SEC-C metal-binding domain-containing protein [Candidatus Gastranaerophilales bacterium]|nr:SEC-C metal-binding domain-containing protein [Candidatus Gastranaerophilales bacterium]